MSVTEKEKQLTGKIARERIRVIELDRVPPHVIAAFQALGDATCAVSDALDDLGMPGAIAGSTLRSIIPGARLVGTALTLRNEPRPDDPATAARTKNNLMAETECHNLAEPGDVLVIQGVRDASNMGGVGGHMGKRQGELGAVVDGAVRDVGDFKEADYPIWSTGVTPMTGKWRVQAVEINGPVTVCGVRVEPGDLVVADDTGVCFVPRSRAEEVLAFAQRKAQSENETRRKIDSGWSVPEIAGAVKRAS
ncbi:RraA family protein [Hydrogenophaga sp.]|uniref:RraA family protein n=1 Tax=Hydrogenophaga sp. TaxID=1904254 RepID=UPI00271A03A1|nr:RraA family protein [Hydrogenophaga sp.]MDO9437183.1 RraA family protein [Hydrogenophaga sp.]